MSATQPPYQVGEQVDVGVLGDDVTLRPASETAWMLAIFVGWAAGCLAVGFFYWRRSRAWGPLPEAVLSGRPHRRIVVGEGRPLRRRPSRRLPLETGLVMPIRTPDPAAGPGAIFVLDRATGSASGSRMPEDGDELEIWDGARASAVHRPADGSWWVTGVDAQDIGIDGRSEHRLSPSAKRIVIPLVLIGALAVATPRFLRGDGMQVLSWSLFAGGFAMLIVAIVVMSRDRRRSREQDRELHSFTDA